jgi:hypothetical protein
MGEGGLPVVIGMDPHKRTVTVEVMTPDEGSSGMAGSPPTRQASPRCSRRFACGRPGGGRSRGVGGSAGTSPSGSLRARKR